MAAAARPQLRGLLKGQLVRHVATVTILSVITVGLTKHFLKDARIKAYEEFYKWEQSMKDRVLVWKVSVVLCSTTIIIISEISFYVLSFLLLENVPVMLPIILVMCSMIL